MPLNSAAICTVTPKRSAIGSRRRSKAFGSRYAAMQVAVVAFLRKHLVHSLSMFNMDAADDA